jgi:hypothetical protein
MRQIDTYILRLVGGDYESESEFASLESAIREADRLQHEMRRDHAPGRWLVYDRDGVPVAAGGERLANRRRSRRRAS